MKKFIVPTLSAVAYLILMLCSEKFIPHPAILFPASAIALCALFFQGVEFWPFVFGAALLGSLASGLPIEYLLAVPISQTLQAVFGAYALRRVNFDPLFRQSKDIFWFMGIILVTALITPIASDIAHIIGQNFLGHNAPLLAWYLRYVSMVFCLLVFAPFILRWFSKKSFKRTIAEIFETLSVFAVLIAIDWIIFIRGISEVVGVPLLYLLFIPLFWIALRLRPRFVTLAILLTSIISITSVFLNNNTASDAVFTSALFQTEQLLIVLAVLFFVMVSVEEDRRRSSNLQRVHLLNLENALTRISTESNAKNDFIAILAHELRNPLAPVVSAIDAMKLTPGRDPEELKTLELMDKMMHTVRRILDDLLDISSISEGKIKLKKEIIDIGSIVQRAIIATTHLRTERHQSVYFKPPHIPIYVNGDAVRLEQVFSNLLTNASKYSNSGDYVDIKITQQLDTMEVVIIDNGIGIDPSVIDSIFTPFHQVDLGERSKKGLGIGLALVRNFIEMHGGSVMATSKGAGKGTQFIVHLPIYKKEAEIAPVNAPDITTPVIPAQPKAHSGIQVLVVDDNELAATGMGKLLEMRGCSVNYAYTGEEAIQKTFDLNPDVILLDQGLPDMEGHEAGKVMRARGYHGKIIALTGYNDAEHRTKSKEVGFEHYLVKPAGLAELQKVIPEIA